MLLGNLVTLKIRNGFVYLKCKRRQLCDGSAIIVLSANLLETINGHIYMVILVELGPKILITFQLLLQDMASTTELPLREIYNNVIQFSNEGVKAALTFRKCEQILQSARRSRYSTNPKSPNEAVLNMLQPNPFSNIYKDLGEFEDQLALFFCSSTLLTYLSETTILFVDISLEFGTMPACSACLNDWAKRKSLPTCFKKALRTFSNFSATDCDG
nr:uncharacterized protein LOC124810192 [Hydra vulgaris]